MKKLIIALITLLFVGFCACSSSQKEGDATISNKKQSTNASEPIILKTERTTIETDPFADHLKAEYNKYYSNSSVMESSYYAFYDIDGDGMQELLKGWKTYLGVILDAIYIIEDGVMIRQEALTSWMEDFDGKRWLFNNGVIRVDDVNYRGGYGYLRFEAGKLKHQIGVGVDEGGEYFSIDANEKKFVTITQEEYNRIQQEMEGDSKVVELDWKPLAEFG